MSLRSEQSRPSSLVADSPPEYNVVFQGTRSTKSGKVKGTRPPSYQTVFGKPSKKDSSESQVPDDTPEGGESDQLQQNGGSNRDNDVERTPPSTPATPLRSESRWKSCPWANPQCEQYWKRIFNCVIVYFGGIGYLILLLVLAIPMVCVGGIYIQECPAEPLIPVYLIVNGSLLFSAIIVVCCYGFCEDRWDKRHGERLRSRETWKNGEGGTSTYMLPSIIFIVCFIWYILGNIWIYSASPPDQDPNSPRYCQKTLYFFAFWTHNVINVLWALWLCFMSCFGVVMCRENRKMHRLKLRVRQRSRQERLVSAELSGVTTSE
ncbi:uncharacterized protein [Ptychodera flava]|uniref:uncharacterized protein n=1 Tax=Ptychodera flava TaxID=63121 RepID=UPI003969EA4C